MDFGQTHSRKFPGMDFGESHSRKFPGTIRTWAEMFQNFGRDESSGSPRRVAEASEQGERSAKKKEDRWRMLRAGGAGKVRGKEGHEERKRQVEVGRRESLSCKEGHGERRRHVEVEEEREGAREGRNPKDEERDAKAMRMTQKQ